MPNKSHFNSGHFALNRQKKNGIKHSSHIEGQTPDKTFHGLFNQDSIDFLKNIPDSSIQLVLLDPPYNLELDNWDSFQNYIDWAKNWLEEIPRVLTKTGNCVIFGGFQYQGKNTGDLLEILYYLRHHSSMIFVNLIVWYYKNGMSAHRFFANRHEDAIWFAKSKDYFFDLDAVRTPFDEKTKEIYKKDKRLNPESIEKGKNPTNVWEINRLNGNSKERVGHPTQKPTEIIRRFVKALSYPGSTVLDFFAGSGTTGRVCIEENRNSIQVDNNCELSYYFSKHLSNLNNNLFSSDYIIYDNCSLEEFLKALGLTETIDV